MAHKLIVTAEWDDEVGVWVATSEDIPGLVTEAKSLDTLIERVRAVTPELLEDNAHLLEHTDRPDQILDIRILSEVPPAVASAR